MRCGTISVRVLLVVSLVHIGSVAWAEDMIAINVIDDSVLENVTGVSLVNTSAGDSNLQLNSAIIAFNESGDVRTLLIGVQQADDDQDDGVIDAASWINDDAFAGAQGLVSLNQGSGRFNLQANVAVIAGRIDGAIVSDAVLSQTRSDTELPDGVEGEGTRQAIVRDSAFEGSAGVIQVNQVAGLKNSTINRFGLSFASGTE